MKDSAKNIFVVRVYGDSLGLPRAETGIACDQTYAELFADWCRSQRSSSTVKLYNRSIGGGDIARLSDLAAMDSVYFGKGPGIMIIQCGIVDCAPRPVPPYVRNNLIAKLPAGPRGRTIQLLHDNRARILKSGLKWRITPPKRFLKIYTDWLRRAANEVSRVYVFNILPTTAAIEKHSPGLSESIVAYNRLVAEAVGTAGAKNVFLVDVGGAVSNSGKKVEEYVDAKDGHHLTLAGHRLFCELLMVLEKKSL